MTRQTALCAGILLLCTFAAAFTLSPNAALVVLLAACGAGLAALLASSGPAMQRVPVPVRVRRHDDRRVHDRY